MNQITTRYITEGDACYEQFVISDPAAKTELVITPERGGMITGFTLDGDEYIWTRRPNFSECSRPRFGVPVLFPNCGGPDGGVHYFDGKAALLSSLSYLFDEKYDELAESMNPDLSSIEKLNLMNQELFLMIDNTVSVDLLSQLFATQLITNGERHMMSPNRTYYKLLRQVISEGKQNGTFREEFSVNDIAKAYAMFERGLMYDWCISGGSYSLCQYSQSVLPLFLKSFCT